MPEQTPPTVEVLRAQSAALWFAKHDDPCTWYIRHLESAASCRCTETGPDPACDQGESLFRVQTKHRANALINIVQKNLGRL